MSDYTLSYTGEEVDELLNTVNSNHEIWDTISQVSGDYIVQEGMSGDWTYRKWNNGIVECWMKTVRNTDITYAWGEFYISQYALNSTAYPIEFVDYPIVTASVQGINTDYAVIAVVEGTGDSLTTSPKVYVGRPSGSSVTAFKDYMISVYVIGMWK